MKIFLDNVITVTFQMMAMERRRTETRASEKEEKCNPSNVSQFFFAFVLYPSIKQDDTIHPLTWVTEKKEEEKRERSRKCCRVVTLHHHHRNTSLTFKLRQTTMMTNPTTTKTLAPNLIIINCFLEIISSSVESRLNSFKKKNPGRM